MITVQGSQQSRASDAPLLLHAPSPSLDFFFFPFFPLFLIFFFRLTRAAGSAGSASLGNGMVQWGWGAPKDVIPASPWAVRDTVIPKSLVLHGWIYLEHPLCLGVFWGGIWDASRDCVR